jgi:hypothetical protein
MKSLLRRINLNFFKNRRLLKPLNKNYYSNESYNEDYSSQSDEELNPFSSSPEMVNMIYLNIHDDIKIDKINFKNEEDIEVNIENVQKNLSRQKLKFFILKDIRSKNNIYEKYMLLKQEIMDYFIYVFNDNKQFEKEEDLESPWFTKEELNILRDRLLPDYDSENDSVLLKSLDQMRDFLILSKFYGLVEVKNKNTEKILNYFINNFLAIEITNQRLKLEDISLMMMVERNIDSKTIRNLVWNCLFKLFDKPLNLICANEMISKYPDYQKIFIFPFTNIIIWSQINCELDLNSFHLKKLVTNILTTIYNFESKLERSEHYSIFKHIASRKFYFNEPLIISQLILKIFIRYYKESFLTIQFFFKNFILILSKDLLLKEYIEEILSYFCESELAPITYKDSENKLYFSNLHLFNKLVNFIIKKPYYNDSIRNSLLTIHKKFQDYYIEKNLTHINSDLYLLLKVSKRVLNPNKDEIFDLNIKNLNFHNSNLKNIISCLIVISNVITQREINLLANLCYSKLLQSNIRDKYFFNNFLFSYYLEREVFSKLIPILISDYSKFLKWVDLQSFNYYSIRETVHLISIFFCTSNYEEKIFNEIYNSDESSVSIPNKLSLENLNNENFDQLKTGNYRLTYPELIEKNRQLFALFEKNCKNDMILLSIILCKNLLFLNNNKYNFQEYFDILSLGFVTTFRGNYNEIKSINKHIKAILKFLPLIIQTQDNDKITFLYLKYLTKFLLIAIKKAKTITEENDVKSQLHKFYEIYIFYKDEFDKFEKKYPRQFYVRLILKKRFNIQRKKMKDGPVKILHKDYQLPNIAETPISDNYFI